MIRQGPQRIQIRRYAEQSPLKRTLVQKALIPSLLLSRIGENLKDVFGQSFVDLTMAGNRLRSIRRWVVIPVMIGAMANQVAAVRLDSLDEDSALHSTSSLASLRIPGISPVVISL